jgi:para-aminobenzoate synthetase component I
MGRAGFEARVERIQEYIRAGDLFQANLTHRISRPTALDGVALLARLRGESPAPYVAYLDTGEGEVVSISPESFLSLRGTTVETRPIKGTARRGDSAAEDARLAASLEGSAKDRAENVMIVDLLRNDLSRVCGEGTVTVPELLRLETHPTVHHLVSAVRGELRPGSGVIDLLRATFPGGSITGAPKIRAMEILRQLESVRRGVYTGALGMLTFEGDAELSVAIRTAVLRDGVARYGTGGGITLASDPEAEWQETLDKAAAFLRATDP